MSEEEIPVPGEEVEPQEPQEGQQAVPQEPEPEPQPETEDVLALKFKGEERLVPRRLVSELAQHIGADEYTAAMRLQKMWAADTTLRESERQRQEWEMREAQYNARLQALEAERQARMHGQAKQTPQQIEEDPIAMIRAMREEFSQTRQAWEQERQRYEMAVQEQFRQDQETQIQSAYDQFMEKIKSDPRKLPVIPFEEIEQEAITSGLAANKRLPWPEVISRAYRNLAWDYVPKAVEKSTLEKMRAPRATVTVPSGRTSPAPPKEPKSDIEKVPWTEFVRSLPEGKF